ncbi:MAG: beta-N-acetylhexosaminidase [Acetatifactor sp.]|nr:beta-N-acetylhexosaminidase [Acetatifactor sp.]
MSEQGINQEQERREARRKRRRRNQTISYVVLIILVILLAVGAVFLAKYLKNRGNAQGGPVITESSEIQEDSSEAESSESAETSESSEESLEESSEVYVDPGPTLEEKLEAMVAEVIQNMTLEEKVAGLFIVTPEAITGVNTAVKAGDGTRKALEANPVGGLIYFAKNIKNADQFKEMVETTKTFAKYDLFLAIDEEGGQVARLGNAGIGTKVDSAKTIGETGDYDMALQSGVELGSNLLSVGLNVDFAPVADIVVEAGTVIDDRSFGGNPQLVGELASAVSQGIKSVGVSSCAKHFPGMGSTKLDPHKVIAVTDKTEEQFRAEEFVAFQTVIDSGVDMVMISNIAAPGLTGNNEPCVFSTRVVTDILRKEMKFDGIIITDAMNMAEVSDYYGSDEAAILSLKAGCDMILMPEDYKKAYEGVLEQVKNGTLSEERINDALTRIYRIKLAGKVE